MSLWKGVREWRTRKDPFESVNGEVEGLLEIMPELDGVTIFRFLVEKYPERFQEGQVRTLQRKVSAWKLLNGPEKEIFFDQNQVPGEEMQLDWMHCDGLGVRIGGEAFHHKLCHCALPYSNWEWACVCFTETLLSLRLTLQEALMQLGRRPKFLKVDNGSAATHQLGKNGGGRDFTQKFESVVGHFGMKGRRIEEGKPNQNGSVEAGHGHLRRRLDQALMLRGSRDFESQKAYEGFVRLQVSKANGLRTKRFKVELEAMEVLTATALTDFDEESHRVGSGSTLSVCKRVYSVPSRLIGQRVNCRIYQERIDLYTRGVCVHSMPRVYASKHGIQWRDLVHWMVRKPGAFGRYRYRDAFFPSPAFVRLHDELKAQLGDWRGQVEYLQVLQTCRELDDQVIEAGLKQLIAEEGPLSLERVRDAVGMQRPVSDLKPFVADLSMYDQYCREVCGE